MATAPPLVGKLVYRLEEGDATQRELLGGMGSNLCEMARLGLPVPPGFIITTQVCKSYLSSGQTLPEGLWESLRENIEVLESSLAREFGSSSNPLLVSVRSGASVSMPGMMDTILNLGINDEIAEGLAGLMDNPRAAYDAYRRFLQIYAGVVLDVPNDVFEQILGDAKTRANVSQDQQLTAEQLQAIIGDFKEAILRHSGWEVPEDPWTQLKGAVEAVFRSWNNARAMHYREYYGIPKDLGTAVTIMSMVYGNLGDTSGTGVLFTRNPSNGKKEILGWKTRGWAEKFGMPLGDRYGVGDTPEQVGSFPEVAAEIVAGYRADVLESVEPVIRGLSEADLETTNPDRNLLHPRPAPTFNWVLARSAPSTSGKCPTYEGLCRTRRVGVDRRWLRSFWVRREYAPSLWENAGLRGWSVVTMKQ